MHQPFSYQALKDKLLMKYLLVGALFISCIIACTKNTESSSDNDQLQKEMPVLAKDKQNVAFEEQKTSERINLKHKENLSPIAQGSTGASKKVKFNNEYFLLDNLTSMRANTEVFNLAMQESGRLTGTIVIVTTDIDSVVQAFANANMSIKEIADETYKLYFKENTDLYSIYNKLKQNKAIKTVEVEVDYSGKRTPDEF